jgi:hypothetical protein
MSKNLVELGIIALGGKSGGIVSDASTATAVLTGLEAVWIEVLSDTTFSVLSGTTGGSTATYEGLGVNVPTGVDTKAGARFGPGYNRKFNSISHNGGQITYFDRNDS